MSTPPQIKLFLVFARESERTVILRQGPSKTYRMILWDRKTDRFEDGQWLKSKVYPERCALSPDGKHFIYFALDGRWDERTGGSYTAISRPPYFTALSLFPIGDTWSGGGVFLDARHYLADGRDDIVGRADGLSRVYVADDEDARIRHKDGQPARLTRRATQMLIGTPARLIRQRFADMPDAASDYITKGAVLYRRRGQEVTPIRDFSDMAFEPIRAPYDWRDGAEEGLPAWHPLDKDAQSNRD